jgi:hypothetical protein
MASNINEVSPTTREVPIEGYDFHVTQSPTGLTITKKGARGTNKPTLKVSWTQLLEIGAEKNRPAKADGSPASAYTFFGID